MSTPQLPIANLATNPGSFTCGLPANGQTPSLPSCDVQVLHLINGEHFSGAERVQQLLGNDLPNFGVRADFACLKPGKFPSHAGFGSDRVCSFPMRSRFDFSVVPALMERVQQAGYQLLHAHTPRTAMVASMVAQRCNIPWVYHVHSPTARDSTRRLLNWINDGMERWSLRNCHQIITVSKSLRREMLRRGWSRNQVVAIGNGVANQSPIDPFSRLDRPGWRMGMVALFRPRKGMEVLIEAIARLHEEGVIDETHRPFQLDIIGGFESIDYQVQVHRYVDELGVGAYLNWVGFTNDVPAALRELDVMVLPSLFGEGMPMVVLEAMALGIPIVATRVEGTPEVVRDQLDGLLATPRDAASLACALRRMMESRLAWAERSQHCAARQQQRFSSQHMASHLARVYRRLIP